MPFSFRSASLNGTLIKGLGSPSFDERSKNAPIDAGTIHQTGIGILQTAPKASFTCISVRSLFSLFTLTAAVPYLVLDGTNGCTLVGMKTAPGVGFDTGTVHACRRMKRGFAVLAGLRWSRGGVLEATVDVFGVSADGATDPVERITVALPGNPYSTEQLGLSALTIGAASILDGVESFELAITHHVENNGSDCYLGSLPFPVSTQQPGTAGATEIIATIETDDLVTAPANGVLTATFGTLSGAGPALLSAGVTVALNGALIRDEGISGSPGQPGRRRIVARGLAASGVLPLTCAVV